MSLRLLVVLVDCLVTSSSLLVDVMGLMLLIKHNCEAALRQIIKKKQVVFVVTLLV